MLSMPTKCRCAKDYAVSWLRECISKLLLDQRIPKCIRWDFLSSNLKYKTWHEKNQKRKLKPRILAYSKVYTNQIISLDAQLIPAYSLNTTIYPQVLLTE